MRTIFNFIFTVLCLLPFSTNTFAQDVYFLDKQGSEVEYVIKDGKGSVLSYGKMVVTDVKKKDAKNFSVTYTAETFNKNKKSLMPPVPITIEIVDEAVMYNAKALLGEMGENVEISGTYPSFPATLEVGKDIGEYSYTTKIMGIATTVSGNNKVTAREEVKTDAGSFDCFKVESEISAKVVLMKAVKTKTINWYAKNIGAVKTETYDNKGKLQTVQEIVSLKK
ncbi:MAG: hypothetical protein LBU37_08285 [Tannerellaceae bacterium]|jgi:hypothetical protein|nr:hypothetical protein [Tannerellaceae bacterium]